MKLNNNELQKLKELPIGWFFTTLGEILPISYGKSLTKMNRDELGSYPVYGSSGQVGNHSEAITHKASLIIGRKGSVGEVYYSKLPCWPIDTVYFVEESNGISLKFFEYFLKGLNLSKLDKSTAVPGLSRDDYNAVEVAVAPIAQQKRIVAEIEKQFSRLDEAVENLKRAKANLKRYKAAVLKAAVEGKLTKHWRKDHPDGEPADKLLERILAERRKRWEEAELARMKAKGKVPKDDMWSGKYKVPSMPERNGLDELPEKWRWCCLGQLLNNIKAGKSFKCEERPPKINEIGVVKVSAVTWGEFDELESKTVTDESKVDQECLINDGDFLFSRANTIELVGACVIVKPFKRRLILSDKILRFDFIFDLRQWCLVCLRTRFGRNEIESLATGNQDSMRNIAQANIVRIRIPLPPLSEQQEIVQQIEDRFMMLQTLEKEVEKNLIRAGRLRQSILKKAFSGQLIPSVKEYESETSYELPLAAEATATYGAES